MAELRHVKFLLFFWTINAKHFLSKQSYLGILVKHGRQQAYVLPQLSQNADKMTAWEQERFKYMRTKENAEDTGCQNNLGRLQVGGGLVKDSADQSLLNYSACREG